MHSLDPTDENAVRQAVEARLRSSGAGARISYEGFLSLRDDLARMILPSHSVHDPAWFDDGWAGKADEGTLLERMRHSVARMILVTAQEVQRDSTHVDPEARARTALMGFEKALEEDRRIITKPKPSRCREILSDRGYRRLHP